MLGVNMEFKFSNIPEIRIRQERIKQMIADDAAKKKDLAWELERKYEASKVIKSDDEKFIEGVNDIFTLTKEEQAEYDKKLQEKQALTSSSK